MSKDLSQEVRPFRDSGKHFRKKEYTCNRKTRNANQEEGVQEQMSSQQIEEDGCGTCERLSSCGRSLPLSIQSRLDATKDFGRRDVAHVIPPLNRTNDGVPANSPPVPDDSDLIRQLGKRENRPKAGLGSVLYHTFQTDQQS